MNRVLFFITIMAAFFSCKKEASNEFVPDPNNPYNDTVWTQTISKDALVNQIFTVLSPPPQTESFQANTAKVMDLGDGAQLSFPVNACPSISGPINVSVNYLKTRGDMIKFGKSTMSGEKLLISGGAFNIGVTQNDLPLQLGDDKEISIRYPVTQYSSYMKVFYGDTTINSREGFTWVEAKDSLSSVAIIHADTSALYEMICKKFDWINCDRFFNSGAALTKISAILPVNFTNKNTAVFLVSAKEFIVARYNSDAIDHLFYLNNIPVGEDFIVVSISRIGDDFYLGTQQTTIAENIVVALSPEKKTVQEITEYLDSL